MAPSLSPAALPAVTRPCGRNGVFSAGQALQRGAGARRLVRGGQAPALSRPTGSPIGTRSGWILPSAYALADLLLADATAKRRRAPW